MSFYFYFLSIIPSSLKLPLGVTVGFLEHVVFAAHVHDAILKIELPFVAGTSDL